MIKVIKSRRIGWAGHVACMGDRRDAYRVWWGWENLMPLERDWCRWEFTNQVELQEVGWAGRDWIDLAQDRERWQALVNVVMHFQVL
jgi:hypothetical protein